MNNLDENTLIDEALSGNDDAFTELFQRYYSFLFKYLLKLTLNEETSRDLAQETMIKCYMNLSTFKGRGKFTTWMISIASRLYIDSMRKKHEEKNLTTLVVQSLWILFILSVTIFCGTVLKSTSGIAALSITILGGLSVLSGLFTKFFR